MSIRIKNQHGVIVNNVNVAIELENLSYHIQD